MTTLFALTPSLGCFSGLGPLGEIGCNAAPDVPLTQFETTISVVIGVTTICAGLWFILQILTHSFKWLVSGGEKQAIEAAHKGITHAVIGLFLVVFSYALISLVGLIFGLRILNPAQTVKNIVEGPPGESRRGTE